MSNKFVLALGTFVALASAVETSLASDASSTWRLWFSVLISRSLYFILAVLIIGSFVINSFKSKFLVTSSSADQKTLADGQWKLNTSLVKTVVTEQKGCSFAEIYSQSLSQDLLKETEARNEALVKELDQLKCIRFSLEERSGLMEREKLQVQDLLDEERLKSALENERLRKETAMVQRKLKQVLEEKELLSREAESAARESRMTECSLRDQAQLSERLDLARKEVGQLQRDILLLRKERDTAMAIAADLVAECQGIAGESAHLIKKFVREKIENSIANNKSTEEVVEEKPTTANDSQSSDCENRTIDECTEEKEAKVENTLTEDGSGECVCQECAGDKEVTLQDDNTSEEMEFAPITGSPAFRNFLISSYVEQ